MSTQSTIEEGEVRVGIDFIRNRNALLARTEMSPVYMDYYLHLMQHGLQVEQEHDLLLKEILGALCLHLASRPINEISAWTIHLQRPLLNLFATGNSRSGQIVGRVFTEGVRESEDNLFFSQVSAPRREPRHSVVAFQGTDPFEAVEAYYRQSEQRPARLFRHGPEDFALLSALPGYDEQWFESVGTDALVKLHEQEDAKLLEERIYRFQCGCTAERIFPVLASLSKPALEEVFAGEGIANLSCPRCDARYVVTEDEFRSFLAGQN